MSSGRGKGRSGLPNEQGALYQVQSWDPGGSRFEIKEDAKLTEPPRFAPLSVILLILFRADRFERDRSPRTVRLI